jgi:hypothetical protein
MLVATFWISDHRARLGTKNWCSSGSSGSIALGAPAARDSSSKRSERRFRKSRPKMKLL